MQITKNEIKDLTISVLVLALIFSKFFSGSFIENFLTSIFIILIVFVSHELSHKAVAQKYGCSAEYRIWFFGLLLGIITALFPSGIIFAAPGAVYISPIVKKKFAFSVAHLTKKEYGKIALAGPLMNLIFGIILFASSFYYPLEILKFASKISFFLAFFNLIPFHPLDGGKIFYWNKIVWFTAIAISLLGYLI